jgi:hypothetical protein
MLNAGQQHSDEIEDNYDNENFSHSYDVDIIDDEIPLPHFNASSARLAHPYFWVFIGTAIFLMAWVFPPGLYQQWFGDTNYLFLNSRVALFNFACIGVTILGIWLGSGGKWLTSRTQHVAESALRDYPISTNVILSIFSFINCLSILSFIRVGGLSAWRSIITGSSNNIVYEMKNASDFAENTPWIMLAGYSSVMAPLVYQIYRGSPSGSWTRKFCLIYAFTFFFACMTTIKRNFIARPLLAILIVFLVWPGRRNFRFGRAVMITALSGLVLVGVFVGLKMVRATTVSDRFSGAQEIARYLFTPYNTEAAILDGRMTIEGAGQGYFWTEWLWKFPLIHHVVDIDEIRGRLFGQEMVLKTMTERLEALRFRGITTVTSMPAFAGSYLDFGWYGVIPFFIVGIMGGWLWVRFCQGTVVGILFFPILVYSFFEWRANILFPSALTNNALIALAIIGTVCAIEKFPTTRSRDAEELEPTGDE